MWAMAKTRLGLKVKVISGPDLSVRRPWAGSLLEAPTHPQMLSFTCTYNNFLLFFCGGPLVVEVPGQLPSLAPALNPALGHIT